MDCSVVLCVVSDVYYDTKSLSPNHSTLITHASFPVSALSPERKAAASPPGDLPRPPRHPHHHPPGEHRHPTGDGRAPRAAEEGRRRWGRRDRRRGRPRRRRRGGTVRERGGPGPGGAGAAGTAEPTVRQGPVSAPAAAKPPLGGRGEQPTCWTLPSGSGLAWECVGWMLCVCERVR